MGEDKSWPIIVDDMSLPMEYIFWPMALSTIMLDDIWLFLFLMLFMDMLCPNKEFGIMDILADISASWVLSLRDADVEMLSSKPSKSAKSWMLSASASRLINLLVLSAVSLSMWNPWSSAM